eukprot:scaffold157419_cov22-Tisochrysis_lutea.AAC.1
MSCVKGRQGSPPQRVMVCEDAAGELECVRQLAKAARLGSASEPCLLKVGLCVGRHSVTPCWPSLNGTVLAVTQ